MATSARTVYRHPLPLRLMHWINVIALTILLGSGLQIFNAHPSLSWGNTNTPAGTWLELGAVRSGDGSIEGRTVIVGHAIPTTGVLGASNVDGERVARGFPSWATIPGPQWLAMGRRWHFFFAWVFVLNGLAYIGWILASGHFRRDLVPGRRDWKSLGRSVRDHLLLRRERGEAALRYNILQRLAYLGLILAAIAIAIMGLAMSPRMDAAFPWLASWVGGRQSARSIHFILACAIVAFVAVHLFEVAVNGVINQVRSIVTGRFRVTEDDTHDR